MLEIAGLVAVENELRAATDDEVSKLRLEIFRPERHTHRV
jgi:hypothetical protein